MAHIVDIDTADERGRKFCRGLEVGDWISLLGQNYQWEGEDYQNDYGSDAQPINLYATHLYYNHWKYELTGKLINTLSRKIGDVLLNWNWKTRVLSYYRDDVIGSIDRIDTVDKLQRALRLIGFREEADNFIPKDKQDIYDDD
jgi:hypothetical protein